MKKFKLDLNEVFRNCKVTPEVIYAAAFDNNCSEEQLKSLIKEFRSEKCETDCGCMCRK